MRERTRASILQTYDAEVASLIAEKTGVTAIEGLRQFLSSKTHEMLADDEMKLWYFSPLAVFDMWENEIATGNPGKSLYLRGDEIG